MVDVMVVKKELYFPVSVILGTEFDFPANITNYQMYQINLSL